MTHPAHSTTESDPRRQRIIPFHQPLIGEAEQSEVLDTLRSGWLTTGPKTRKFEERFAEHVGAEHAVALNSCTAALHLALVAHDIGPGDEVLTSPMTFAATVNVIEHVGAKPVFVDVRPDNLNIDTRLIEAAITPRTRAIIPIHFAGHPCDLDAVHAIADAHDLVVIEDAAHALGASYRGRDIGGLSRASCFSFYATKNITTGEGGMITTDDAQLAERLRILSLHGISVHAWQRYRPGSYRHWDIIEPGYKYNMFDIQAAIGLHQLARLNEFNRLRREHTDQYDQAFSAVEDVEPLVREDCVDSAYHLYIVRLPAAIRDTALDALQQRGVGIGVHFRPVHRHPYYRAKYNLATGSCPVAEEAGARVLSLPLFPQMTPEDVRYVVRQVDHVLHDAAQRAM